MILILQYKKLSLEQRALAFTSQQCYINPLIGPCLVTPLRPSISDPSCFGSAQFGSNQNAGGSVTKDRWRAAGNKHADVAQTSSVAAVRSPAMPVGTRPSERGSEAGGCPAPVENSAHLKCLLSLTRWSPARVETVPALDAVQSTVIQFRSTCFHTYLQRFFKYDLTFLLCEKHFILSSFPVRF